MLGLVFIYFMGNLGYKLAERFGKNKWLFAFVGIVVYYGGMLSFAVFYGFLSVLIGQELPEDWEPSIIENLIFIALGAITFYAFYKLLEKKWIRESVQSPAFEIDSIGQESEN